LSDIDEMRRTAKREKLPDTSSQIDIVGYSRGGAFALLLAKRLQERDNTQVRFLGLIDPVLFGMERSGMRGSRALEIPQNVRTFSILNASKPLKFTELRGVGGWGKLAGYFATLGRIDDYSQIFIKPPPLSESSKKDGRVWEERSLAIKKPDGTPFYINHELMGYLVPVAYAMSKFANKANSMSTFGLPFVTEKEGKALANESIDRYLNQ
jgi:pimeloyl-ACP methyl ester carboxylesterase